MNVAYSSSAQPDEGVNASAVNAWLCVVSQNGSAERWSTQPWPPFDEIFEFTKGRSK